MTEPSESNREHWQERSRIWAKTAPQGKTQDDTFNQMIIAEAGIRTQRRGDRDCPPGRWFLRRDSEDGGRALGHLQPDRPLAETPRLSSIRL